MGVQECPFCDRVVKTIELTSDNNKGETKYRCSYCKKEWRSSSLIEKKKKN